MERSPPSCINAWESSRVNLIFQTRQKLPVSLGYIQSCLFFSNAWEKIDEIMLMLLHTSFERGHINPIFSPDLADGMKYMLKQFPFQYVASTRSHIWRCLIYFSMYGREQENKMLNTFLHRGCVRFIFLPDLALMISKINRMRTTCVYVY